MANMSTAPKLMPTTSHGIWQGDDPTHFSLPLLILQMLLVLAVTRLLGLLLKPLRQPRVIAEIMGGILLGPSVLGQNKGYMARIFPKQSICILATLGNMGLMFFLFMVGLELDLTSLRRSGKKATAISVAGIAVPFAAGVAVSFVLHNTINPDVKFLPFLVFMGVALSITAFPVLARILAERKLLTTDVGEMALAAAAGNDVVAWIFLALAIALSGSSHSPAVSAWILLCGVAFVVVMFAFVKPVMTWIAHRSPDDQPVQELYVCIALGGVLVSGLMTDFIGIHGIFGAFVFGLVIPDGHFSRSLNEKIEDFVSIFMLPLYFAASGLQTNIGAIKGAKSFGLLLLVIVTACGGKILGTLAVSMAYGEKFRKALTLGFLMNTKGLVELIVLNIGRERKVLNEEMFAIMVIMALFTSFIITPLVMAVYKPARDPIPYKRRGLIQPDSLSNGGRNCAPINLLLQSEPDELRVLACVHGIKNMPSIMNLVEITRGTTKRESLRLYILHLVEFSERSSAIKMVQRVRRDGLPFSRSGSGAEAAAAVVDGIDVVFGSFAQLNKVVVRLMTAISSLVDMHDDICTSAAVKRAALVILPFHKYARADGVLETMNSGFQGVNQRVLLHAPCSVGILVDRGGLGQQLSSSDVHHDVVVLFFGGPDDREALLLGLRMAEHPGVKLTILRFTLPTTEHSVAIDYVTGWGLQQFAVTGMELKAEARFDEECIANVKQKLQQGDNSDSIFLEEEQVSDPVDAAMVVSRKNKQGLLLVGRARHPVITVNSALSRKPVDFPELGPIGDALASGDDLTNTTSVLVVQQYLPP